jgi:polysaccharide export outer membrane protein
VLAGEIKSAATYFRAGYFPRLVGLPTANYFSLRGAVIGSQRSLLMNIQRAALLSLICGLLARPARPACAQSLDGPGTAGVTGTSTADGTRGPDSNGSPALTGARHPLYRLRKSDVVEIKFTFSPEFDQTAIVLPDGFLALKTVGDLFVEGLTVAELKNLVRQSYAPTLRDPEVSVILKDFERPFFVAGGQVARPGKYELRSPTTVAEAVAVAGGFTEQSKHSQVIVFRTVNSGVVEVHVLNVKTMLASRNLEEDLELQPGDMLFVPQNRISKIRKFLPVSSLSTFFTPAQF